MPITFTHKNHLNNHHYQDTMKLIIKHKSRCLSTPPREVTRSILSKNKLLIVTSLTLVVTLIAVQLPSSEAAWFFNSGLSSLGRAAGPAQAAAGQQQVTSSIASSDISNSDSKESTIAQQQQLQDQQLQQQQQSESNIGIDGIKEPQNNQLASSSSVSSNGFSIGGIRPSMIATLLNTVGDTGFRYFNIEDQCRNRAACDLGFMLYKKLSFAHNWLIRTSVRSLTDMNNMYTQSWMEGMMGRNCTTVYMSCRQSPLDGLMNIVQLNLQ